MEQKIYFDTYDIPDVIIDAFVDKVIVYKDRFEWYLNLFDKDHSAVIYSKSEIKHNSCMLGEVSNTHQAVSSTGRYSRGALIHSSLFLGTFEISKDFMKKSVKIYYNSNRIFQFPEKLEIKIFLV